MDFESVKTYFGLKDKLTFGKFKGLSIEAVVRAAPSYIYWCLKNVEFFGLTPEASELLNSRPRMAGRIVWEDNHWGDEDSLDPYDDWDSQF